MPKVEKAKKKDFRKVWPHCELDGFDLQKNAFLSLVGTHKFSG